MKTYSLILVIFLVSFLDLASAWRVYCESDSDVEENCEGLKMDLEEEFHLKMEWEAERLDLDVGRRTRKLRGNDERELSCAYCLKYKERWCLEYPYNLCRRREERFLGGQGQVIADSDCVALIDTAETLFKGKLRGSTDSKNCEEALEKVHCGCLTDY
jgi:hypothetical protein